jgi:polyisoprenoid-binding protein YceI
VSVARYRIVPERSRLTAEARSSLHPIHVETTGLRGGFEAELVDGGFAAGTAPTGHVELDAKRLKTGNGLYDGELERRLETRKFRVVGGDVREVTALDGGRHRVAGDLSFHGVTHAVEGTVRLRALTDRTVQVEGDLVFDMRHFDLEPPRLLMLKVHPQVRVHGHVVAEKEGA